MSTAMIRVFVVNPLEDDAPELIKKLLVDILYLTVLEDHNGFPEVVDDHF